MSSPVVVRSPQDCLNALKTVSTNPPAIPAVAQPEPSFAPLTLGEIEAKIAEYRLARESDALPLPIREELDRRLVDLVKQQYAITHDFIPDAEGNNPAEVKDIVDAATQSATKSVIDALAAAPAPESSEGPEDEEEECEEDEDGEEFDLDEQVEVLNEIDEADAAVVVSPAEPTTTAAPRPVFQVATEGIFLSPEAVMAFRASVAGNLPHVTARLVTMFLGK